MKFKCLKCDGDVVIEGPFTAKLGRNTRLIASPIGSKVMSVKGSVHCPKCDDFTLTVLSPVRWLDLLLKDLKSNLLVIKSSTNVSLYPASTTNFNGPATYKLDAIEIEELVHYGKITFSQNNIQGDGSTIVGDVSFKNSLDGNWVQGNNNESIGSVTVDGQKINCVVIGNGIAFYQ